MRKMVMKRAVDLWVRLVTHRIGIHIVIIEATMAGKLVGVRRGVTGWCGAGIHLSQVSTDPLRVVL